MRALPCIVAAILATAMVPVAEAQVSGGSLAGWNMSYTVPGGWQVQRQLGRVQVLGSMNEAGALYVAPGLYGNFQEVQADIAALYATMGVAASPVEPATTTTLGGKQAMAATYASYDQMGQVVHHRIVAVLSPHGTGLVVVGMTTPQMMGRLRQTVESLAASLRVSGPPQVNQQLVQALRGRWMFYEGRANPTTRAMGGSSRSYEEWVEFDGQGTYAWQSSASVSVTTPGYSGGAGGANATNDRGTYTVIGTTLVVRGQRGQQAFDIQVQGNRLVAGGRTFVRN